MRQIKLIESGMSQRKAAKLLGVDESTVRADVRENPAESAGKSRTGSAATKARRANRSKSPKLVVHLICATAVRRARAVEWLKAQIAKVCEGCATHDCDGEVFVAYPPKSRVHFGSVCPRHPWLKGLRRIRNCVECQRTWVRERRRAERTETPLQPRPLTPRQRAIAAGELYYHVSRCCRNGHPGIRLTSSGKCLECQRAAVSRHRHRRALAAETLKQLLGGLSDVDPASRYCG
jgi:predicted transcriptional regulator